VICSAAFDFGSEKSTLSFSPLRARRVLVNSRLSTSPRTNALRSPRSHCSRLLLAPRNAADGQGAPRTKHEYQVRVNSQVQAVGLFWRRLKEQCCKIVIGSLLAPVSPHRIAISALSETLSVTSSFENSFRMQTTRLKKSDLSRSRTRRSTTAVPLSIPQPNSRRTVIRTVAD